MGSGIELSQVMNSPGLWIASAFTVIASVGMALIFFKLGTAEAKRIGMPKERVSACIRSAAISSAGPSISPVIILVSMIAVVGAPTTWMRLCDVGAGRTELAVISLAAGLVGAEPGTASFGMDAFTISLWGMALNNFGWLFVTLVLTSNMDKCVDILYSKYDKGWIDVLLSSCTVGMFGYLSANQIILTGVPKLMAGIAGAVCMLALNIIFKKNKRIQEVSLGISMIFGMFIAQAFFSAAA